MTSESRFDPCVSAKQQFELALLLKKRDRAETRHFAWHTERTLELIGDRVTVFMGVPTYRPLTYWAEDLPTALRGIRRGLDALPHRPAKPFGVGVYADWTTSAADWARYRAGWLPRAGNRHISGQIGWSP